VRTAARTTRVDVPARVVRLSDLLQGVSDDGLVEKFAGEDQPL
jgi:hypothetical protein